LGFATVMGSTTGGGTAAPVTVTTLTDLIAYAGRAEPAMIRLKGMISVPPGSQILVGSNKTIVGADMDSGLTGGGFLIRAAQNVIVRNLVIALPVGTDGIAVQAASHVWIDHCELYSDTKHSINYYGWLVDIAHGSAFVTVSWTWFHDHFNTVQVGHFDRNDIEDTNHLTVTLHHNLFQGTVSGARVQFGTVHIFNNHYQNIPGYAIASLKDARVAAEENVFDNVAVPLTTERESSTESFGGRIEDLGNIYYPSRANAVLDRAEGVFTFMPSDSYPYLADSTNSVPVIVGACAGPSRIQKSTGARPDEPMVTADASLSARMTQP
jgi:pectate lyase